MILGKTLFLPFNILTATVVIGTLFNPEASPFITKPNAPSPSGLPRTNLQIKQLYSCEYVFKL